MCLFFLPSQHETTDQQESSDHFNCQEPPLQLLDLIPIPIRMETMRAQIEIPQQILKFCQYSPEHQTDTICNIEW